MIVLDDLPPGVRDAVKLCRERVCDLHAELTRYGLVVWTAGNVSERVPGTDSEDVGESPQRSS